MEIPSYFRSGAHAISVTVIGAGGTGSEVLRHLARIHLALLSQGVKGLLVTCVDPDVVTEANLGRQIFTKEDIGSSKAIVLIERINRFYGTSWLAMQSLFDQKLSMKENFPGNIIISCVDRIKARKDIFHYFSNNQVQNYREEIQNHYWIDTGNNFDNGQIVLHIVKTQLPTIFDMFPELEKSREKKNIPSCSLAQALGHQSLFINTTIAQWTAQLVWNITQNKSLRSRGYFINLKKSSPIKEIPL